ncbi:adenosylcobinamide-GDP ribazoletransferase [Leeia oryzae]|uniref:adenosylcobinamide-GDP ribazoletransferase n=1 Tax=Leeia oryzae TaxID=356662 RepID=UPI0003645A42|nr:adenosylcobinamide-GDP ribazoletransferase [Leeia oryzae]
MKQRWITFLMAVQFLTRLPTPRIDPFNPALLPASAIWFPLVGLIIGSLLWLAAWVGHLLDPWLAAVLCLMFWVWVTGGLHLDGLADMSDALGAAHRDPARFLAVLKDPHLGSFGVIALVMQLLAKLVGLMLLVKQQHLAYLLLIPAWARLGTLYWSRTLPPLGHGMAEQFQWQFSRHVLWIWAALLMIASAWLAPALLAALALTWWWKHFLIKRVGGVTGDCLGAGVEILESGLLLLGAIPLI